MFPCFTKTGDLPSGPPPSGRVVLRTWEDEFRLLSRQQQHNLRPQRRSFKVQVYIRENLSSAPDQRRSPRSPKVHHRQPHHDHYRQRLRPHPPLQSPAQVITLGVGQRSDILVRATGNPSDAFWMRSEISTNCSHTNQPTALAAIYYEEADTSSTPKSIATSYEVTNCTNDAMELTEPLFRQVPPETPAFTQDIEISFKLNDTGALVWMMNN
jgi:hypothetical protein